MFKLGRVYIAERRDKMKITGRIEKKEDSAGTSDKGEWVRSSYTIDGKKYSTFDKKIIDTFKVGENVELETKTSADGKYENMVSMKLLNEKVEFESAPKVAKNGSNQTSFYTAYAKDIFVEMHDKDSDINEANTMELAINLVKQAREAFE